MNQKKGIVKEIAFSVKLYIMTFQPIQQQRRLVVSAGNGPIPRKEEWWQSKEGKEA